MSDNDDKGHDHDRVRIVGQTPGGDTLALRCNRGEKELLTLRRAREGAHVSQELIALEAHGDTGEYDLKSIYRPASADGGGPPKVASNAYRAGWDAVFGTKDARPN